MLLTKGLEIEQYTGTKNGEVLPLSALISSNLKNFTIEPDQRNVEFITEVTKSYDELLFSSIKQRWQLRDFLSKQDPSWTIIPGSVLTLPFEKNFIFSKPDDLYHRYIQENYGLNVVTTSIHYNIGLQSSPDEIIRIMNLLKLECPLVLALSANSPFYDGEFTGNQSHRWLSFPKVPEFVPFFSSHQEFINWTYEQINEKQMFNIRHFWSSIRPNGDSRPENINRLEIRIADLNTSWDRIMAIMAWLELRILYFLHKQTDLQVEYSDLSLINLNEENEKAVAIQGLSGHFSDWILENENSAFIGIENRLPEMYDLAKELNIFNEMKPHLKIIENILTDGNEAQQKIEKYQAGLNINEIMQDWIIESLEEDQKALAKF